MTTLAVLMFMLAQTASSPLTPQAPAAEDAPAPATSPPAPSAVDAQLAPPDERLDDAGPAPGAAAAETIAPPPVDQAPPPKPPDDASTLARGLFYLDELEVEHAVTTLAAAERERDYTLDEVRTLYIALGTALALAGDEKSARTAFDTLLGYDEHATISYRSSSRVTFIFDAARRARAEERSPEVLIIPPVAVRLGEPMSLLLRRMHDPRQLMQTWTLSYRLAGENTYRTIDVDVPEVGKTVSVELPAVSEADATVEKEGLTGAIVEVALTAHNARNWEVFSAPTRERPLELPVGFDAPGPWYTSVWFISLTTAAAAGVVAAIGAGAVGAGVLLFIRTRPPPNAIGNVGPADGGS